MTSTEYLARPEGRIAFTATGTGPLVVLAPGMGDVRGVWRDAVGPLAAAGHRVVAMDLRGHGDSDATFAAQGVRPGAEDLAALVEHLGAPAVLVGHSVSAGAAAIVAAERPELVRGLAMISPHLRLAAAGLVARLSVQAIRRPFGRALWRSYYAGLNKGRRAPWFDEHLAAVDAALRDGAHLTSFGRLARALLATHTDVPLGRITAPTLVLHGALDPEFDDPADELALALDGLTATPAAGALVPDAGHYAHAQRPDVVVPALLELLAAVREAPRA